MGPLVQLGLRCVEIFCKAVIAAFGLAVIAWILIVCWLALVSLFGVGQKTSA